MIRLSGDVDRIGRFKVDLEKGPSDNWIKKFMEKHKDKKWCKPQPLDMGKHIQSSEYIIMDYFNKIGMYCYMDRRNNKCVNVTHKPWHAP